MKRTPWKIAPTPAERLHDENERLRGALWLARTFASQVTLHAFEASKAADLQNAGNTLIDAIDDAMYGGR